VDSKKKIINDYYHSFCEQDRLSSPWGEIELLRTQEILNNYLPPPPALIVDIGGATGRYSAWLAGKGYEVHLLDLVTLHLYQAQNSHKKNGISLCSYITGDARKLPFKDNSVDVLLFMGPLYHLTEKIDRLKALHEGHRLLTKGGFLFAAGISRFASCIDGLIAGYHNDPEFRKIMVQDITDGQHRNPTGNKNYFTEAYFHHPEELKSEIAECGFKSLTTHAVEGIGYMMKDFDRKWQEPESRGFLLALLRSLDQEPSLIGASPHILCVAGKEE